MANTTPLAFNTAMKVLTSRQLYEYREDKLCSFAQTGEALHQEGLDAARILENVAVENAANPSVLEQDMVAGWLFAATLYALHGDLQGAERCVEALSPSLLIQSPTYGMVASFCSPGHLQSVVLTDTRLVDFGRTWAVALNGENGAMRQEALDKTIDAMVKTGMGGGRMDSAFVLGARTAAWQVQRLLAKR